ncbi:MAG: 3-oxoacyl-ACP reductase FabG [Gammaproteobacteria bacterium]|nr:MAG: 3-oxoacyl-ACP reductase FabG [Gammaproteobacteria bacterium]|tara:strand:+ start:53 stop:808 length:756 start_codon:yes stop_codon:yes gene_type:complete
MTEIYSKNLLKDQVALVTGASRGIGASIAQNLSSAGAYVIGTATSKSGAKKIDENLEGKGVGKVLNVTDAEDVKNIIDEISSNGNGLHILVNNAGITRDNLLIRMKADEWNDVIAANLSGIFNTCKLSIKKMMKQKYGRIINIASVVAHTGNPGQVNYAATKSGLIGFSKSLAREVASRNITVNVVAPGFIKTDMTATLSDDQQKAMMENIPLNRFGKVGEVSDTVVFLASNSASYITGETININGGMSMN